MFEPNFIALQYPLSVNRYWTVSPGSHSITPTIAGRAWKQAARALALSQGAQHQRIAAGPVAAEIVLLPRKNKDSAATAVRLDLDNCLKIALDAMQGVLFTDDRQVVELQARVGSAVADGALMVRVRPA